MDVIPLRTVRPLIFRSVALSDLKVDLTEPDPKKLALDVERHLRCLKMYLGHLTFSAGTRWRKCWARWRRRGPATLDNPANPCSG